MNKNLIIIPTYNEKTNIKFLINNLYKHQRNFDLLFIDDNSPDKTAEIIKKIQLKKKNIILFIRKKKAGIGSAHKMGLNWAFKKRYKKIITMDADGTHHPRYIKKMLKESDKSHLVITNRFLKCYVITNLVYFKFVSIMSFRIRFKVLDCFHSIVQFLS